MLLYPHRHSRPTIHTNICVIGLRASIGCETLLRRAIDELELCTPVVRVEIPGCDMSAGPSMPGVVGVKGVLTKCIAEKTIWMTGSTIFVLKGQSLQKLGIGLGR